MATYTENFSGGSLSPWTVYGSANVTITTNQLAKHTNTTESRLIRKTVAEDAVNGWTLQEDQRMRMRYVTSSTLSGRYAVLLKVNADGDYARAIVNIGNNTVQVDAVTTEFGTDPLLAAVTIPAHNTSSSHWLELEFEDYTLAVRWGRLDPASNPWDHDSGFVPIEPASSPGSARYMARFGKYSAGRAGILFQPDSLSHRIDDIEVEDADNPLNPHPVDDIPSFVIPSPYRNDLFPPEGWRLLHSDIIFNTPIDANAKSHPRSDEIVTNLLATSEQANDGPSHLSANNNDIEDDSSVAVYFAKDTDPLYTITSDGEYGIWPYENVEIHCPEDAIPAPGVDLSITIIQEDGTTWDFYKVQDKDDTAHTMLIRWGGSMESPYAHQVGPDKVNGSNMGASAANFLTCVGLIWPEEFIAGNINHALQVNVQCTEQTFKYPARGLALPCNDPRNDGPTADTSSVNKPVPGMRFQLEYTEEEIDALTEPDWLKGVLKALSVYGFIVSDTNAGAWGFRGFVSPVTYTAWGYDNPFLMYALERQGEGDDRVGLGSNGAYAFRLTDDIDWTRIRVLDYWEGVKIPSRPVTLAP
jgi:hypothetical protein